jgi:hypothetical protein
MAKDFAANVGTAILYGDTQLAVFNNVQRGEWYCTQNMCPHKQAFVLSQGIIGDTAGKAGSFVPLHKKQRFDTTIWSLNVAQQGDLQLLTFSKDCGRRSLGGAPIDPRARCYLERLASR